MTLNCSQCNNVTGDAVRVQDYGLLCPTCFDATQGTVEEKRAALVAFYEDRAAMYRSQMEDFELMGRTVQYLDDAGVALEYAKRIERAK